MIYWIVPLFLLVLFEALADLIAKSWANTGKISIAGLALFGYIVANIFWLISLKNGAQLSTGAIIFSISSELLAIAIGIFLYHEQLTKLQIGGIVLGVISLILLIWE